MFSMNFRKNVDISGNIEDYVRPLFFMQARFKLLLKTDQHLVLNGLNHDVSAVK